MAFRRPLIKDKEKRNRVIHIISGMMILIHAYEKYEGGHESYLYFAIAGLVLLTIALLHPVLERRLPWVDGVFFCDRGHIVADRGGRFFSYG